MGLLSRWMMIGMWSDDSLSCVVQVRVGSMLTVVIVRSGAVGWCLGCVLVGFWLLAIVRDELSIMLSSAFPRVSVC